MVEFKWIKTSLFLIALLQFTAAEKLLLSFTVRDEDEVTLHCENMIKGQDNCVYTTWTFTDSRGSPTVEMINLGQIGEGAKSESDRLSVTANCSLVIKKVTVEDVGRYFCQQYNKSGQKQGEDSLVYLSVINNIWWLFVIVAVVLVALLITVVVVIKRRRAKGNKSRMNGRVELTSNPAETRSAPETGQDTADPEDGVSYASISYTKKRNSKAKVRRKNDDDEGDAVTYTTVKASSTDPSNLYATIS